MQIVAQRAEGAALLLADGPEAEVGQVWVRDTNELWPEQSVSAITKFGYWDEYAGGEDADAIIDAALPVQTPGPSSS